MSQALEDARHWLRYAQEDLRTAERLVEQSDIVPRHPAWLAQQAAEKAFKAALIADDITVPYTHDLELLSTQVADRWSVKQVTANLGRLSEYAVDARYPGNWPDLSVDDARAAVEDARRIVDAVQVDLNTRPGD